MSNRPKVRKQMVALKLYTKSVPQIIAEANLYVQKMTGNPSFPNPSPPLTDISTESAALEAAFTISLTRAKGTASQMHAYKKTLCSSLKGLAAYVETIANKDPDTAEAVICSTGMPLKKPSSLPPKEFSVKQGPVPGNVIVNTKAITKGAYIYQLSTTPDNPASWTDAYKNAKAKGSIYGLTPGMRYYFRVATVDTNGESAWSPQISLVLN